MEHIPPRYQSDVGSISVDIALYYRIILFAQVSACVAGSLPRTWTVEDTRRLAFLFFFISFFAYLPFHTCKVILRVVVVCHHAIHMFPCPIRIFLRFLIGEDSQYAMLYVFFGPNMWYKILGLCLIFTFCSIYV